MSITKRLKAAAMAAVTALAAVSLAGCERGVSEDELRSIIAEMNAGSDSGNGGNYGNDNGGYGNNNGNYGNDNDNYGNNNGNYGNDNNGYGNNNGNYGNDNDNYGNNNGNYGNDNDNYGNNNGNDNNGYGNNNGNYGNDNNNYGNNNGNYDYGNNDFDFGNDDYDFGEVNTDGHYSGNAAAGNHQYEEVSAAEQYDGIQPGTATVEWNGVEHSAAASYQNTDDSFGIRATFDGKHVAMVIYKNNVGEGDYLKDANGDFDYDKKIGFVSFVDFPTTNGTVYNGGTNVSTMYDLEYFDGITLNVKKFDPDGITEFVCVAWVDMGDYGDNIFKITAAVDANTSQSYGSGGSGGSTGGGGITYGSDKCGYCNGVGTCQVCGGMRKIYVPSYVGEKGEYVYCSSCNGSGKCEWCNGTGKK